MRLINVFLTLGFVGTSFMLGIFFFLFHESWIDVSRLEHYNPGRPSVVLDCNGNEWARFAFDRREPIAIDAIPKHVIEAFLSAEDWHFYSHYGISWRGIIRSLFVNLYHGKKLQGASTITQQMVKLLFFDLKKTFSRKLKEQLYAVIIEQQFTKPQILEIYLNHLYFGCGVYGVQAAAKRFWGIDAQELSIDQAALLAGIIQSPANYCPLAYPQASILRRNRVLAHMQARELLSQEQYEKLSNKELNLAEPEQQHCAPYAKEMIRQFLEEKIGRWQLYTGGYTIATHIDPALQKAAEKKFAQQVAHLQKNYAKPVDGGAVSFDVQTGAIRALIGGQDFAASSFNRVTQGRRQLGSVFKPMVYAAAMQQGLAFDDVVIDEPLELKQGDSVWAPGNWNKKYNGPITRAYALTHSNNIVTIKTLLEVGADKIIELAKKCQLPGPYFEYPSLALGCIDGSLLQAGAMFNIFANNGKWVQPYLISWVKDRWGKRVYQHEAEQLQVIDQIAAHKVAKVLMAGLDRVKKWFAHEWYAGQAISKTGTTNDSRTCWYIGSTPELTTAVYIGCDDNQSLGRNIYPVHTAFPIWLAITRHHAGKQGACFTFDPSLQSKWIDEVTGKVVKRRATDGADGLLEIF